MSQPVRPDAPLVWGSGPHVFEMFIEPTCPFSARAFGKMNDLLTCAGPDRITVKLRLHSQPWHLFSGIVTRCVLAAATLPGGKESAHGVLAAVYAHREEFAFEDHCRGPNMDATPNQIIARIEGYSSLALAEAFRNPALEASMAWQARYSRQNGIHVSPSFMVDGIFQPGLGSADPVETWAAACLQG